MKIRAIRGRNLASLAGDFVLDFTTEPLAHAGLFTIIGETGAGKSTILDALCLALYGQFPRLAAGGSEDRIEADAGETMLAQDPRSILRTGMTEALAEVELGIGDDLLLARWRVWRARGRADGQLQPVERSLIDLRRESVIASGKGNVDTEIEQRLGLTYEQFRRTVLLAQNEFDAFLRAKDTERADLLERITGTALYSRLSMAAYEQDAVAKRAREELRSAGEAVQVLGEDERQALLRALQTADERRTAIEATAHGLRAALEHHARLDELTARLEEAGRQRAAAADALAAEEAPRRLLAQLKRIEPLRGVLERAQASQAELARLVTEASELRAEREQLERDGRAAEGQREAAGARLAAAVDAQRQAAPMLDEAMRLDERLKTHQARRHELEQALAMLAAEDARLEQEHATLAADIARRSAEQQRLEGELQARAAWLPLISARDDIDARFTGLAETALRSAEEQAALARLSAELEQQSARVADDARRAGELSGEMETARRIEEDKARLLAALKPDALRLRRDHLAALQERLAALLRHSEEERDRLAELAAGETVALTAAGEIDAAAAALAQLGVSLGEAGARRREAAEQFGRSQSILSAEVLRLRAGLQAGDACPVCGATDHPGHDDALTRRLIDDLRRRQGELDAAISQFESQIAAQRGRLAQAQAQQTSAERQTREARAKLAALGKRTLGLIERLNLAAHAAAIDAELAGGPLERLQAGQALALRCEAEAARIEQKLRDVQRLEGERQRAADGALRAAEEIAKIRAEGAAAAAREQQLAAERAEQLRVVERLAERHDTALQLLAASLGGTGLGGADLLRDATGARRHVEREIEAVARSRAALETLARELAAGTAARAALVERVAQAKARHSDAAASLASADEGLDALRASRGQLLAGRPAEDVRSELDAALAVARSAQNEAALRRQELATRLAALEQTMAKQQAEAAMKQAQTDRLLADRQEALAAAGMSLAEIEPLLATSGAERDRLARRIEGLDEALLRAEALLADRRRQAEELAAGTGLLAGRDEARENLAALTAEQAQLSEQLGRDRLHLQHDDEARARRQQLGDKTEAAEREVALWGAISEAIGARDGAKFRRFAQGVTLDHLVMLANGQLRGINPRYEIERPAAGGLSLQVVDLEMAGERRSVRSLSGGERFLVSLALALALSRLDSRAAYVDTLLIDEGFGALDARSLDMAVEALERLQSEGRRVGVISHVEALKERIPVQVVVEKQGDGRSRVRINQPGDLA